MQIGPEEVGFEIQPANVLQPQVLLLAK